jgi:hypothetical protein
MSGRFRSIEQSNDLIGNETRVLACSIVPQAVTLLHAPCNYIALSIIWVTREKKKHKLATDTSAIIRTLILFTVYAMCPCFKSFFASSLSQSWLSQLSSALQLIVKGNKLVTSVSLNCSAFTWQPWLLLYGLWFPFHVHDLSIYSLCHLYSEVWESHETQQDGWVGQDCFPRCKTAETWCW